MSDLSLRSLWAAAPRLRAVSSLLVLLASLLGASAEAQAQLVTTNVLGDSDQNGWYDSNETISVYFTNINQCVTRMTVNFAIDSRNPLCGPVDAVLDPKTRQIVARCTLSPYSETGVDIPFAVTVLTKIDVLNGCSGRTYTYATVPIDIDTQPPTVLAAAITVGNLSRAGQPLRVGDTVRVQWTDPNGDATRVSVASINLGLGLTAATSVGGGIWRLDRALSENGFDGAASVTVYGWDRADNLDTAVVSNVAADLAVPSAAPASLAAVNPPQIYGIGDVVQAAYTNDGQVNPDLAAVSVDFGEVGGPWVAAVQANGVWTASHTLVEEAACEYGVYAGLCLSHLSESCVQGSAQAYCEPFGRVITLDEFQAVVADGWVRPDDSYHTLSVTGIPQCPDGRGSVGIPGFGEFTLWQCGDDLAYCNRALMCVRDVFALAASLTDDVGNVGIVESSVETRWAVDVVAPKVDTADISVVNLSRPGETLRIGDTVRIVWDASLAADAVQVRVDSPELGIVNGQATKSGVLWTYQRVLTATGYDGALNSVMLRATDAAGNEGRGSWPYQQIGSFRVNQGPSWGTAGLQVASCVDTCLALNPNQPGTYACSTTQDSVNRRAFVDGWGDSSFCAGNGVADTYRKPQAGGPYDCGSVGCSYSAYVNDHNCPAVNVCWLQVQAPLQVDLQRPVVSQGAMDIDGATGDDGSVRIGDTLVITWSAGADGNADIAEVEVDFGQVGGPAVAADYDQASGLWTAQWLVTPGQADHTQEVGLTAWDDAGNSTSTDTDSFLFDNQLPTVQQAYPLTLAVAGAQPPARVGNRVELTWVRGVTVGGAASFFPGNADVQLVTTDFSAFGGGPVQLQPGAALAVVLALDPVPEGQQDSPGATVPLVLRDDAGNVLELVSPALAVDNQPPTITPGAISVAGDANGNGVYQVGETLSVFWNNGAAGGDGNADIASVFMDFSALGGPQAQPAQLIGGLYRATLALTAAAVDAAGLRVTVSVQDDAGYSAGEFSPQLSVDRSVPGMSQASLTLRNATRAGEPLRVGDTLELRYDPSVDNPAPLDIAAVAVNFAAVGGPVRSAEAVQGIWVASYQLSSGSVDAGGLQLVAGVQDDGGNQATGQSPSFTADNLVPKVCLHVAGDPLLCSDRIAISGASGAGGVFLPGDTVLAQWTPPALQPDPNLDLVARSADFSDFGCPDPVPLVQVAGPWQATCVVPAGAVNSSDARVGVALVDDVGNVDLGTSDPQEVHGTGPAVSTEWIAVSNVGRPGQSFRIGDVARVVWDNAGNGNPGNQITIAAVEVDFASFGGPVRAATSADGGQTWSAEYTVVAGAIDSSQARLRVTAYDDNDPPLAGSAFSGLQVVDNQAPRVTSAATSFSGASGTGGVFRVGDRLEIRWDNTAAGDNNGDVATVGFDLRPVGGGVQAGVRNADGTYTANFVMNTGAIDSAVLRVPVTVTDDLGNVSRVDSRVCAVDNQIPVVTLANFQVLGATGANNTIFRIGDVLHLRWSGGATGDGNTDTLAAVVAATGQVGGPATLALRDDGVGCDATPGDGVYEGCYTLAAQALQRSDARVNLNVQDNAGNWGGTVTPSNLQVDLQAPTLSLPATYAGQEGSAITLAAAQISGAATYEWAFGDGSTAIVYPASHVYVDNGSYAVSLTVRDAAGNSATANSTALVANVAPAVVPAQAQSLVEGGSLAAGFVLATFSDPGTLDTHTATVAWGDGGSEAAVVNPAARRVTAPAHRYGADGVYSVSVTVTDKDGGASVGRFDVTVSNVAPQILSLLGNGSAAPEIPEGGTLSLAAQGTDPGDDDQPLLWTWSYGDGGSDEGADLATLDHVYGADSSDQPGGRYTVTLRLRDSDGAEAQATLSVRVVNVAPTLQPLPAVQGAEGQVLSLVAQATDPGDAVLTYTWDTDLTVDSDSNGVPDDDEDRVGPSVQVTYPDSGEYQVAVVVRDDDGATARAVGTVTVNNLPPVVTFDPPEPSPEGGVANGVCQAGSVRLTASLTDPSSPDLAAGFEVEWDFGDGTAPVVQQGVGADASVEHVYGDDVLGGGLESPFSVTLTARDKDGGEAVVQVPVEVSNVAPHAVAGVRVGDGVVLGRYSTVEGAQVPFTAGESCDPGRVDDPALVYAWDFGDGAAPASGEQAEHTFFLGAGGASEFTVTLTVTDPQGGESQSTIVIVVDEQAPVPVAAVDPQALRNEGSPIHFEGAVANPVAGETYTYFWNWGDNSPLEEGQVLDHAFPDNGTFRVILGVYNSRGTPGWLDPPLEVVIANVAPTAAIQRQNEDPVGEGSTVGLRALVQDPGSADTFTYAWDCDGNPATVEGTGSSVSCPAPQDGVLTFGLRVSDDDGGSATASLDVTVQNLAPVALAPAEQRNVPEGSVLTLQGNGQDPGGDPLTYTWYLPDGQAVPGRSLSFPVPDQGEYLLGLEVEDNGQPALRSARATTRVVAVNVAPLAVACGGDFDPSGLDPSAPPAQCRRLDVQGREGEEMRFTALARDPSAQDSLTYAWDFGVGAGWVQGPDPTQPGIAYTYAADGNYTLSLRVSDEDGGQTVSQLALRVLNVAPSVESLLGDGQAEPSIDEGGSVLLEAQVVDPGVDDAQLTYIWTFGDGERREGVGLSSLSHRYAQDSVAQPGGRYTVNLTVRDSDGAQDAETILVAVANLPPALDALADLTGDEGQPVLLRAQATDPGADSLSYRWDLDPAVDGDGDGVADNDPDLSGAEVQAVFSDSGERTVAVTVSDERGATDSAVVAIHLNNLPPAVVLPEPPAQPEGRVVGGRCEATPLVLRAELSDPGQADLAAGLRLRWDFGDGTAPVEQQGVGAQGSATHVYGDDRLAPDLTSPFTVTVEAEDKDGGRSSATVSVVLSNVAPLAVAGVPVGDGIISGSYSTAEGRELRLSGAASCDPGRVDSAGLSYEWDFGDGSPLAAGLTQTHTFFISPAGQDRYEVVLRVTDPQGASSTSTLVVVVDEQSPVPAASVDPDAVLDEGSPILFSGVVTNPVEGEEYSFVWSWGDNTPNTEGQQVEHAFPDDGEFTVILGAFNSRGTPGYADPPLTVVLRNVPPTVAIERVGEGEIGEGEIVHLRAAVQDPGVADTHTYAWDCDGDPETVEGEEAEVDCRPAQDGTLRVSVRVLDDDGGLGEASLELPVVNRAPVALAPAELRDLPEGSPVTLLAGGRDPGGDPLHYVWHLPDGSTVERLSLSFTPEDEGDYALALEAIDDGEPPLSSPLAPVLLHAVNLPPVAAICANALDPAGLDPLAPPPQCRRQNVTLPEATPVTFTALARDPGPLDLLTYSWDFGDGEGWRTADDAAAPQLTHTFDQDGVFEVALRVDDEDGGSVTIRLLVQVANGPPIIEDFPAVVTREGEPAHLTVQASDPGGAGRLSYRWDFGDGGTALTAEPAADHAFLDSGAYTATVVVTDEEGLSAEASAEVQVENAPPVADAGDDTVANEGDVVRFEGGGSDPSPADAAALSYEWDFGDGSEPAAGQVVEHQFRDEGPGSYDVRLTVTDPDGATASDTRRVLVFNVAPSLEPVPDMEAEEGRPVHLRAVAQDPGLDDALSFDWDFGDGDWAEGVGPELDHVYADDQERPFRVQVSVSDGDAQASDTFLVLVRNVPPTLVLDPPPPGEATQGVPYRYLLQASDPGQDELSFQLEEGPEGMAIEPGEEGSSLLVWVPGVEQIGQRYTVALRVDDGDGGSDRGEWEVEVAQFVDSDGDGLPDGYEDDPAHACLDSQQDDAALDPDGDGLSSAQEFQRDPSGQTSDPCRSNAPGPPPVVAPEDGGELPGPLVELVVAAAEDGDLAVAYPEFGDLEPLHYHFELGFDLDGAEPMVLFDNLPEEAASLASDELCLALAAEADGQARWELAAELLQENEIYQWRARACDGWAFGAFSAPATFRLNAVEEAPAAPEPLAPAEGELVASDAPLLEVAQALDPDGDLLVYHFAVYADRAAAEAGGEPLNPAAAAVAGPEQGNRVAYSLEEAGIHLAEDTRPCFIAWAEDDTGLSGPPSSPRCFGINVDNAAPGAPELVEPAAPAAPLPERWLAGRDVPEVTSLEPTVVLRGASDPDALGALAHWVELDRVDSFDSPARVASPDPQLGEEGVLRIDAGVEGEWVVGPALQENGLYHLRARAWDGQTFGPAALGLVFVNTVNEAPATPRPLSPSQGELVQESRPAFRVMDAADLDPDRDPLVFEVQVARDEAFEDLVAQGEAAAGAGPEWTWNPDSALASGSLFWRVRARDDEDEASEWSSPLGFTRSGGCDELPAPALLSPADDALLGPGAQPTLSLSNVAACEGQALAYDFQVLLRAEGADDVVVEDSATPVAADASGETSYRVVAPLGDPRALRRYVWRARSRTLAGGVVSPWSEEASFQVRPGWASEVDGDEVAGTGYLCGVSDRGGPGGQLLLPLLLAASLLLWRRSVSAR